MAMTRYVALAVETSSREDPVTISSTEATATTHWNLLGSQVKERMSCMVGMATIFLLAEMGGTSSIAAKARTATLLTRSTMWTAAARRGNQVPMAGSVDSLGHR